MRATASPPRNRLFRWQEGQHKTGYFVLTLAWVTQRFSPIPFDCYLLRYPPGSSIPPHRDVTKRRHFRANIVLTHPKGGEFQCERTIFASKWLNVFRPDRNTHSVTPVTGTRSRYVLSIGWSLAP